MKNSQEIAIIIKNIAKSKKITIGKMLSDCELSINTLSSMQSGGYYPRLEAINKIADYLDCSVDYLLGRTDIIEPSIETDKGFSKTLYMSPHEKQVLSAYRAKPEMQTAVDTLLGIPKTETDSNSDNDKPEREMVIAAYGGGLTKHKYTATDEEIDRAIKLDEDDDFIIKSDND